MGSPSLSSRSASGAASPLCTTNSRRWRRRRSARRSRWRTRRSRGSCRCRISCRSPKWLRRAPSFGRLSCSMPTTARRHGYRGTTQMIRWCRVTGCKEGLSRTSSITSESSEATKDRLRCVNVTPPYERGRAMYHSIFQDAASLYTTTDNIVNEHVDTVIHKQGGCSINCTIRIFGPRQYVFYRSAQAWQHKDLYRKAEV
mmetsp:Transcript_9816/g.24993  ORF Transcript_9816/g.24993 Transcript_9816/m.24993 type:complete len:200 (+) Transcript_9816:437-1036(+)